MMNTWTTLLLAVSLVLSRQNEADSEEQCGPRVHHLGLRVAEVYELLKWQLLALPPGEIC